MDQKKEETPTARIILWALVFVVMLAWRGPTYLSGLQLPDTKLNDFCQDWISARYCMEGVPVYSDQKAALGRHLGRTMDAESKGLFLTYNAHPPASILFVLPLASFPYETASRIWSLFWLATFPISIFLVARALDLRLPWWSVFPIGTLLLWCNPLGEEFAYGQFNLMLLLLIVSGWALERAALPWLGGALLGIAAAIKLFPAFLFLPFLVRRDWKTIAGGMIGAAAITLASLCVLGIEAHIDYVQRVIPHVGTFRSSWMNLSLPGFFARLFHPARRTTQPIIESRLLYLLLTGIAAVLVFAACVAAAWRSRSVKARDQSFALVICGMLLLSPTTWAHYCLLLTLPVMLLWRDLPEVGWQRPAYYLCLLVIWLPPFLFHSFIGAKPDDWFKRTALPWQTLTAISIHCYALVLFFLVASSVALAKETEPSSSPV